MKPDLETIADFLAESNAIEGYTYNGLPYYTELKQASILGLNSDKSGVIDPEKGKGIVPNSVNAFKYLYENCKRDLKMGDILELHKRQMDGLLPKYQVGCFRNASVLVSVSGFIPPKAEIVAYHVDDFIHKMNDPEESPSLECHYLFEYAHPFADGNGRVGRLLWAWNQIRENMGFGPFLDEFTGKNFFERRDNYYNSIQDFQENKV